MYMSMFPARNKDNAPYNNTLNRPVGICFSAYANRINIEKLTATSAKYNFFSLFIRSLGFMTSFLTGPGPDHSSPEILRFR